MIKTIENLFKWMSDWTDRQFKVMKVALEVACEMVAVVARFLVAIGLYAAAIGFLVLCFWGCVKAWQYEFPPRPVTAERPAQ